MRLESWNWAEIAGPQKHHVFLFTPMVFSVITPYQYLEPQTTIYKWLFPLDDSQSLHRKWLFHQTSIYKLLFGVPGNHYFRRCFIEQLWFVVKNKQTSNPIRSMGLAYLSTFGWCFFFLMGEYTDTWILLGFHLKKTLSASTWDVFSPRCFHFRKVLLQVLCNSSLQHQKVRDLESPPRKPLHSPKLQPILSNQYLELQTTSCLWMFG